MLSKDLVIFISDLSKFRDPIIFSTYHFSKCFDLEPPVSCLLNPACKAK